MKKVILFFILIVLSTIAIGSCLSNEKQSQKDNNMSEQAQYVPNEETAKKIAEAIWLPIYGDKIYNQKPYIVSSLDSIWVVEGSLPDGMKGGGAYIEIQKSDCKILKVTHGK